MTLFFFLVLQNTQHQYRLHTWMNFEVVLILPCLILLFILANLLDANPCKSYLDVATFLKLFSTILAVDFCGNAFVYAMSKHKIFSVWMGYVHFVMFPETITIEVCYVTGNTFQCRSLNPYEEIES